MTQSAHTTRLHILPRSRRGTWLLAGAVWCAACAGLWWALPVVPRAVLKLANDGEVPEMLSFGDDSTTAIIRRWPLNPSTGKDSDIEKFEIVEVSSGRVIGELPYDGTLSQRLGDRRGPRTTPTVTQEPESELSLDGRYIMFSHIESSGITVELPQWLQSWLGVQPRHRIRGEICATGTGEHVGDVFAPKKGGYGLFGGLTRKDRELDTLWASDSSALALRDPWAQSRWLIWDIPPRRSLTWFAAGAALLALPIALLAWRRTRKLRAA